MEDDEAYNGSRHLNRSAESADGQMWEDDGWDDGNADFFTTPLPWQAETDEDMGPDGPQHDIEEVVEHGVDKVPIKSQLEGTESVVSVAAHGDEVVLSQPLLHDGLPTELKEIVKVLIRTCSI